MKKGQTSYKLKCGWNEDVLVVAMITPWAKEWDYVQQYRGLFGWGDVGNGFYAGKLRKMAASLLLDELIRRNQWMQENPSALVEREREIQEYMNGKSESGVKPPHWFAAYRWIRNRMATFGEGDKRLYVKGDNHIWGAPVQCEWAISDMLNKGRHNKIGSKGKHEKAGLKHDDGRGEEFPFSAKQFFGDD